MDTSDLNIMLLDRNQRVIRTFGNGDYEVSGANGVYNLTLKVHTDYFAYAGKEPTDMVDFSLLFIANLNGISGADGAFGENYLFNTIQELSQSYRGFLYTGLMGDNSPWLPSLGTTNRLIPMAGVAAMSVKRSDLNAASAKDKAIELPDIYIQRSMAKVRLVDALAKNGDNKHKIEKVTLTGFNSRGAYLPLLTEFSPWANETSVVEYGTALKAWWNAVTELPSAAVTYTDEQDYVGFGADMEYEAYNIYVPELGRAIAAGELQMLAVYVGEDRKLWQEHAATLPQEWLVGIDAERAMDRRELYNIGLTPSFYLIDAEGRVQIKDGTLGHVLGLFGR